MTLKKNDFDGIIVLSNLMDSQGKLNDESCLRADKAVEVYRSCDPGAKIVTCGWNYRSDCKLKIADVMSRYISDKYGISEYNIIKEYKSRDTVGDAIFTRKDIVTKYKLNNLAIVTSTYHAKRSEEIFKFVYDKSFNLSFFSCLVPFDEMKNQSEILSLTKFRKTFSGIVKGDIDSIYNTLLSKHPYYNGQFYQFF